MKKQTFAAIGMLVLSLNLALTGCSQGSESSEDTVAVQSVSMLAGIGAFGIQDRYSGKVVAQATQEINKMEERTIKELKVAVGDTVKKGDVLFTYDLDELRLAIDMGKLELEKLQNSIDSTKKQIEQMEKDKKKAGKDEQLSYSIEIQTMQADIKESEYQIKAKTMEQEQLEKTLGNADVKAPIDGVVQSINENGDSDDFGDNTSSAYIVLMETGNYRVQGVINEMNRQAFMGMEGASLIIRSRVDTEQIWMGKLDKVDTDNPVQNNSDYSSSGEENSQSTNYPFYVSLENSDGLMMGQHVYIELDQGQTETKTGIWLPSSFVDVQGDDSYVWAATDKDKLERRAVTLGDFDAELDQYQILDGVAASDYVAIVDISLKEGLPVARYDEEYFEDPETGMDDEGGDMDEEGFGDDGEEFDGMDEADMDEAGMDEGLDEPLDEEIEFEEPDDGMAAEGVIGGVEAGEMDMDLEELPGDGAEEDRE